MPAKTTKPKAAKKTPGKKPAKARQLSALDAAARVLGESGGSMNTKELIEAMAAKKLWSSPNGKTPAATLYAAILREITTKGTDSRFKKTEPGKFAATGKGKGEEVPAPAPKAKKAKAPKGAKKKPAGKKPAEPNEAASIPDGTEGPESMKELFRFA